MSISFDRIQFFCYFAASNLLLFVAKILSFFSHCMTGENFN